MTAVQRNTLLDKNNLYIYPPHWSLLHLFFFFIVPGALALSISNEVSQLVNLLQTRAHLTFLSNKCNGPARSTCYQSNHVQKCDKENKLWYNPKDGCPKCDREDKKLVRDQSEKHNEHRELRQAKEKADQEATQT